jgi:hypothetical protein
MTRLVGFVIWLTLWSSPVVAQEINTYQVIRSLAPHLSRVVAKKYSKIINRETSKKLIDPLLLIAFIHSESNWRKRLRSFTNDYGLTQVHVAERGSATFLGRETELYDPNTNIKEWCRLAAMWRNYHARTCKISHHWWSHLKWGYLIKKSKTSGNIERIYELLQKKYQPLES